MYSTLCQYIPTFKSLFAQFIFSEIYQGTCTNIPLCIVVIFLLSLLLEKNVEFYFLIIYKFVTDCTDFDRLLHIHCKLHILHFFMLYFIYISNQKPKERGRWLSKKVNCYHKKQLFAVYLHKQLYFPSAFSGSGIILTLN